MAEPTYVVGSVPGFANRPDYVQPYVGEEGGLLDGATASEIEDYVGGLLGNIDFGGHAALQYPEGNWYSPMMQQDYYVPFGSESTDTSVDDEDVVEVITTEDDDEEIYIPPPGDDEEEEEEEEEEEVIDIWSGDDPVTVTDIFPDSPIIINPRSGREETTFTGITPYTSTYDLDPGFDYVTEYSPYGAEQRGQSYTLPGAAYGLLEDDPVPYRYGNPHF